MIGMEKRIAMKKGLKCLAIMCVVVLLSGCGASGKKNGKIVQVTIEDYQKNTCPTVSVQYGTIEPELVLKLKPDKFESKTYPIKQEMLEVKEMKVEKGSKVKAGDVMVAFRADEIEKTIAEYEERKTENQMLIEHYSKLMKISKAQDYSDDIKRLKNDLEVAEAYIKEQNIRLSDYVLTAQKDGTVTDIDEDLYRGYAVSGKGLITVASGSSNYKASTTDDFAFQPGDIYQAQFGIASYDMKVLSVEKNGDMNEITFEPASDMSAVAENDELTMTIKKNIIQNTLYVEEEAVFSVEGESYVFLVDEKGFKEAAKVTIGETMDGYVIIKDGLKEGEQVAVK